jgi:hypothetical protein
MLEAISKKAETRKIKFPTEVFFKFALIPLKAGIGGFALFFSVLLFTKFFAYLIGTQNLFEIDVEDLLLSTIGFILAFLIRFLENFKEKD